MYTTQRLAVEQIHPDQAPSERTELLGQAVQLLSPAVVQSLPPDFHGITSIAKAATWLLKITREAQLFTVRLSQNNELLGFVFLHHHGDTGHMGYLLGETHWGKGYASECLGGFIQWCQGEKAVSVLIGGVEKNNLASRRLLEKLGFKSTTDEHNTAVVFYEYTLH